MKLVRGLVRTLARDAKTVVRASFHTARDDLRQIRVKRSRDTNGRHVLLNKPSVIEQLEATVFPPSKIRISLIGASRRLGNPNNRLGVFLDSVLRNSYDAQRIEVLVAIDHDDDIEYFLSIKNSYLNRLNIRFIVSQRRFGYEGLHHYEGLLFAHMAESSRMAFLFADDCIITRMKFDTDLIKVDRKYKYDNLYFVHTNYTYRAEILGDCSVEIPRLLWMLQAHGPHSHFPIVSKGVIEAARMALYSLVDAERSDWSPLANSWRSDCFIDVLSAYVKAEGADRIEVLPMITVAKINIQVPFHYKPDRFGLSASNRAFLTLLAASTQSHLLTVARKIAATAMKTDSAVAESYEGAGIIRVVYPSQNDPLTAAEYAHCCSLIDHYSREKLQVAEYCQGRGRDPLMFDRGGVWQEGFADFLPKMLLSKNYDNINRMRLIGWQFSAYRLLDLSWVTEPAPNEWYERFYRDGLAELPKDIDLVIKASVDAIGKLQELTPRLDDYIDCLGNKYIHGQPMRFGEVAADYRGYMVNGDSQRYWGTVAFLHRAAILEHIESKIAAHGICRVLEIGPGYGGLGYQLKRSFGDRLQFIAVDLVESLLFSSCYLTTTLGEQAMLYQGETVIDQARGLIFVPAFRSPEFFEVTPKIDLFINTISMNEMSASQVDYYGRMISATMARDGLFIECNWNPELGGPNRIDVKTVLEAYFNDRLDCHNTEMAADGNLSLWSNGMPATIAKRVATEYDIHKRVGDRDLTFGTSTPLEVDATIQAA